MFPDVIQPSLEPGSLGPVPILLRKLVFIIAPVINRALHEDCFPDTHVDLLLGNLQKVEYHTSYSFGGPPVNLETLDEYPPPGVYRTPLQ